MVFNVFWGMIIKLLSVAKMKLTEWNKLYLCDEINNVQNINTPKLPLSGLLGALPGPKGRPGAPGERFSLPDLGDSHLQGQNLT